MREKMALNLSLRSNHTRFRELLLTWSCVAKNKTNPCLFARYVDDPYLPLPESKSDPGAEKTSSI